MPAECAAVGSFSFQLGKHRCRDYGITFLRRMHTFFHGGLPSFTVEARFDESSFARHQLSAHRSLRLVDLKQGASHRISFFNESLSVISAPIDRFMMHTFLLFTLG